MSVRSGFIECGVGLVWLTCAFAVQASAQPELLMVSDPACGTCRLFEQQVGAIYDRTDEAACLPLRRVDREAPELSQWGFDPATTRTPTFLVVQDDVELGRFDGYSSDELFWMSLANLVQDLPADSAAACQGLR